MYLRPLFNTLCLRFFHEENILLEFIKVLWRIKEASSLKDIDSHQKVRSVIAYLLWWKKWVSYWSIKYYPISMNFAKRKDVHLIIKCHKGSRSQTKNRVKNSTFERQWILGDEMYIKKKFWRNKIWIPTWIILSLFFLKFSVNSCKDTKLSKHLVHLERKN